MPTDLENSTNPNLNKHKENYNKVHCNQLAEKQ